MLQVYGSERSAEHMGLLTEFADGGTLYDHVITRGPLTAAEAKAITQEVCTGLRELHEAGIVHRDLKPANVLRAGGIWKLGDFGISKNLARLVTQGKTFQGLRHARFRAARAVGRRRGASERRRIRLRQGDRVPADGINGRRQDRPARMAAARATLHPGCSGRAPATGRGRRRARASVTARLDRRSVQDARRDGLARVLREGHARDAGRSATVARDRGLVGLN
jgi:serine/threonine protein kinase